MKTGHQQVYENMVETDFRGMGNRQWLQHQQREIATLRAALTTAENSLSIAYRINDEISAELEAVKNFIRRHQYDGGVNMTHCISCSQHQGRGHTNSCELNALIQEATP